MQAIAADGVSFAIPIDSARLIIDQVITGVTHVHTAHAACAMLQSNHAYNWIVYRMPLISHYRSGKEAIAGSYKASPPYRSCLGLSIEW